MSEKKDQRTATMTFGEPANWTTGFSSSASVAGVYMTAAHENVMEAVHHIQQEVDPAIKRMENDFYHAKYADLSEVWSVLVGLLGKYDTTVMQPPISATPDTAASGCYLTTIVRHKSGEMVIFGSPLFLKDKTQQAFGSALTYLRRQVVLSFFGIQVAGEDDDGAKAAEPAKAELKDERTTYQRAKDTISAESDPSRLADIQQRITKQEELGNIRHDEAEVLTQMILVMNCTTADRLAERMKMIEATNLSKEAKTLLSRLVGKRTIEMAGKGGKEVV